MQTQKTRRKRKARRRVSWLLNEFLCPSASAHESKSKKESQKRVERVGRGCPVSTKNFSEKNPAAAARQKRLGRRGCRKRLDRDSPPPCFGFPPPRFLKIVCPLGLLPHLSHQNGRATRVFGIAGASPENNDIKYSHQSFFKLK